MSRDVQVFVRRAEAALRQFRIIDLSRVAANASIRASVDKSLVEVRIGTAQYTSGAGPSHVMVMVTSPEAFVASYPIVKGDYLAPIYFCEKFGKKGRDPLSYDGGEVYSTLHAIDLLIGCVYPTAREAYGIGENELDE